MAELLILNQDNGDPKWEVGDVVEVYPNGRCSEEPSPDSKFIIVKIPDLDYETAKKMYEQCVYDGTEPNLVTGYRPGIVKHRRYNLSLPTPGRSVSKGQGVLNKVDNMELQDFLDIIMDKTDG